MTLPPAPLRFLLLVVGCWVGVRTISLLPGGVQAAGEAAEAAVATPAQAEPAVPTELAAADSFRSPPATAPANLGVRRSLTGPRSDPNPLTATSHSPASIAASPVTPRQTTPAPPASAQAPRLLDAIPAAPPAFSAPRSPNPSRWAGSAWAFFRDETGGGTLAPGGTLGGSQAGARLTYRLNSDHRRPLSLSARLYTPIDNARGAEAALGIDWRPIAAIPINLLAERRQAIGRDGRSDFALMLHGGAETRLARGRVRIEAYGQAGIVGVEARDLFADGAVTATTRIGPVDLGGGAWGGAQPGASRLDLGPHASFSLPVGRATIRASAEWRFRVAGDAAPDSGPALTISAGF